MKRCTGTLFAVAFVGAVLSACGGSASPSTSTVTVRQESTLSKAQFISQGDEICQSARDEYEPLMAQIRQIQAGITLDNESSQLRKLGELLHEGTDSVSNEVEELRSLEPPNADRETIIRMLALVDSEVSLDEEAANASEENNSEKIKALIAQVKPTRAKAQGIAQGYGFKVCGRE